MCSAEVICLKFFQKSSPESSTSWVTLFFAVSVRLCWCIAKKSQTLLASHQIIQFSFPHRFQFVFLILLPICFFLWVDRINWPMPTVVYTTRKSIDLPQCFLRRRFFFRLCVLFQFLTHFVKRCSGCLPRLFVQLIERVYFDTFIVVWFSSRSNQPRNWHTQFTFSLGECSCMWVTVERIWARDKTKKKKKKETGLLIMIQIW